MAAVHDEWGGGWYTIVNGKNERGSLVQNFLPRKQKCPPAHWRQSAREELRVPAQKYRYHHQQLLVNTSSATTTTVVVASEVKR
jgi:hypothetical protein